MNKCAANAYKNTNNVSYRIILMRFRQATYLQLTFIHLLWIAQSIFILPIRLSDISSIAHSSLSAPKCVLLFFDWTDYKSVFNLFQDLNKHFQSSTRLCPQYTALIHFRLIVAHL